MSWLDRDGVRIHFELIPGPDSVPPLVLTHGFAMSAEMWRPNVDALSQVRTVITWDLRGHGQTDAPDDPRAYSHDASVADLAAVLDECGAQTAAVGGLSLGGYLSLAFQLRHPNRVESLVLCDTGPGYRSEEARARWNERVHACADRLERDGLDGLPRSVRHYQNPIGLAKAARGIETQHDAAVIDSLSEIRVPTLIIVGANDTAFRAAADYLTAAIPSAHKVVIPAAGHLSNLDQPERFNAAVAAILRTRKETSPK
jgi:pimeloyl-ACP methyl ester carboxylesterase